MGPLVPDLGAGDLISPMQPAKRPVIGILGGTGAEGSALALRCAAAGFPVVLGSRDVDRANVTAAALATRLAGIPGAAYPRGGTTLDAARAGDLIALCVPYAAQADVLAHVRPALQGKTLMSVVVPLRPPDVAIVHLPPAGSAAAEAQACVGAAVRVVAAFQHVAAARLRDLAADAGSDVLVCGDDPAAKGEVLDLIATLGLVGYDAGPLANAGVIEGLAAILIAINRHYGARAAGIRITNVPPAGLRTS